MNKRTLRAVILSALAIGIVLGAALPAWADHTGFSKDEYEVSEGAGYVELSVVTTFCCPVPQGQIDYYTSDSTAIAGQDYRQTSGTMTFAGSFGQTIRVPITNDQLFEGEEQFAVTLTNYRGTFVNRGRTTAVVRIHDDDPKPASNSVSPGRTSPSSPGTSSGASKERSGAWSSGTAGDPTQPSHPISEEIPSDEGALTQDGTSPPASTDHPRSAAPQIPKAPMVPVIASGILLALAGAVLLLLRRRRDTLKSSEDE